jgi:formate hydrogenlyase transcriptional activator
VRGITLNPTDVSDSQIRDANLSYTDGVSNSENREFFSDDNIPWKAGFTGIVGHSRALREVLDLVDMVAPGDSTVLVLGETGTGKELIARAIHNRSPRNNRTLVKVNCAAIPGGLLESELFGHERGAFTGAITQKIGRIELADQGSLFLDEIGDIPLELQPKLLRVLQEREFERLGSTRTKNLDVRIIAATHRSLEDMIVAGEFRSDLYYRLNVFPISVPALRERPEDIPLLERHFANQYAQRMNKEIDAIPFETMEALIRYSWPGNIRELQNIIERAVVVYEQGNLTIKKSWLSREGLQSKQTRRPAFRRSLMEDREMIWAALAEAKGRVSGPSGAAAKLGIPSSTLESMIKSMNIDKYIFKVF